MDDLEKLRYPVGRLDTVKPPANARERSALIDRIAEAPAVFRSLVHSVGDAELDTPYRPGGWTIRQVIHHVPDSHMNAYIRMKLAATEDAPLISGTRNRDGPSCRKPKAARLRCRSIYSMRCTGDGWRSCARCRSRRSRGRSRILNGARCRSNDLSPCTSGTVVITQRTSGRACRGPNRSSKRE